MKKLVITLLIVAALIGSFFLVKKAFAALTWNNQGKTSAGSAGSTTVIVSTTTLASNMLVVLCDTHETSGSVSSVTDTFGLTWTKVADFFANSLGDSVWYAYTGNNSGAWTATSTLSGSLTFRNSSFVAYGGFTNPALDVFATSTGTTGNTSVGSKTTNFANEVVYACAGNFSNSNTFSAGSGYTLRNSITASDSHANEDQITSGTGSFTGPMTVSASQKWVEIMATFYDNAAASTPTVQYCKMNDTNSKVVILNSKVTCY